MSESFLTDYEEKSSISYPTGPVHAVCSGVYDLGMQESTWKGKTKIKHMAILLFEIETDDGKRQDIAKKYSSVNLSLEANYKSALQKDLESWRDSAFTEEEVMHGFDLYKLYGLNCTIIITKNDKGYYNISTISRMLKGAKKIAPKRSFSDIPEWVQKIVDKQVTEDEAYKYQSNKEHEQHSGTYYEEKEPEEDDIPF
jgi:hypothetical protein